VSDPAHCEVLAETATSDPDDSAFKNLDAFARAFNDFRVHLDGVTGAQRTLPVPVLAAVRGTAFGAGLQLMLGADLRFVAPATKLSIMEIEYGLIPDLCGTQLWGNLVRDDVMRWKRGKLLTNLANGAEALCGPGARRSTWERRPRPNRPSP